MNSQSSIKKIEDNPEKLIDKNIVEFDFNHDGKVDYKRIFNPKGRVVKISQDNNFDGKMDFRYSSVNENVWKLEFDRNHDEVFEEKQFHYFENNKLSKKVIIKMNKKETFRYDYQKNVIIHYLKEKGIPIVNYLPMK